MVLIYDKLHRDPRITQLGDAAFGAWMLGVKLCSRLEREAVSAQELQEWYSEAGRTYDADVPPATCSGGVG